MKAAALFGLVALIPVAAPSALAAGAGGAGAVTIIAADCLGGSRAITVPRDSQGDPAAPQRGDDTRNCFKGCHAGASRKRAACGC